MIKFCYFSQEWLTNCWLPLDLNRESLSTFAMMVQTDRKANRKFCIQNVHMLETIEWNLQRWNSASVHTIFVALVVITWFIFPYEKMVCFSSWRRVQSYRGASVVNMQRICQEMVYTIVFFSLLVFFPPNHWESRWIRLVYLFFFFS